MCIRSIMRETYVYQKYNERNLCSVRSCSFLPNNSVQIVSIHHLIVCFQVSASPLSDVTCDDLQLMYNQAIENHDVTKEDLKEAVQKHRNAQDRVEELEEELSDVQRKLAVVSMAKAGLEAKVRFFYGFILPHVTERIREANERAFAEQGKVVELKRRLIEAEDKLLEKMVNKKFGSDEGDED